MIDSADAKSSLQEFLKGKVVLIVEPSTSFATMISSFFNSQGVPLGNVFTAKTSKDALAIMDKHKPKVFVSEFTVGADSGLDLLDQFQKGIESLSSLSIIVSKESSDSAVAEAAEEQVDCFVLKPFSISDFGGRILEIIGKKMRPSAYSIKTIEARSTLQKGNFDEALALYKEAQTLQAKPVSAHCGAGEAHFKLKDFVNAQVEFTKGLSYQPMHYRCLTGIFESLMEQRQFAEAYKKIAVICKSFPVTSHRLGAFFIVTVYSGNFQDLPGLFEIYKKMEYRPPKLVNLVAVSFLTAGRLMLRKKQGANAIQYFDIGASVSGRSFDFLSKVIDELIVATDIENADRFFKMLPPEDANSPIYAQLKFRIDCSVLPPPKLVEAGRQIIVAGKANESIVRMVVELMAKEGRITQAEAMIQKGVEMFPAMRQELFAILEEAEKIKAAKIS